MCRCVLVAITALTLLGCNGRRAAPGGTAAASLPPRAATASSAPAPASATPPREVAFDGGVARIEADSATADHVLLLGPDGGIKAESTCTRPYEGYDAVRSFFEQVRSAILANDAAALLNSIAFPLRVNAAETHVIASREQFLKERDQIITRDVIEQVRLADPGQVFCNWQGDMLGDGVMWAQVQPNDHLAVSVINVGRVPHRKEGPKLE